MPNNLSDNLFNLIAAIAGRDKLEGGPVKDPTTGEIVFEPYKTAKGGFLATNARRRAEDLNATYASGVLGNKSQEKIADITTTADKENTKTRVGGSLLERWIANAGAKDVANIQESGATKRTGMQNANDVLRTKLGIGGNLRERVLANKGQVDVAKQQGINATAQEREGGKQTRKNIRTTAKENRRTGREGTQDDIYKSLGISPTKENIALVEGKLMPVLIELQKSEAGAKAGAAASPEYAESMKRGMVAQNLAPDVKNISELRDSAPMGSTIARPSTTGNLLDYDLRPPITTRGATVDPSVGMYGGYTMANGQPYGAKPVVTNTQRPGTITRPINPALYRQAMQQAADAAVAAGQGAAPQANGISPTAPIINGLRGNEGFFPVTPSIWDILQMQPQ